MRDIANAPTTSVKFSVRRVHAARRGFSANSGRAGSWLMSWAPKRFQLV